MSVGEASGCISHITTVN